MTLVAERVGLPLPPPLPPRPVSRLRQGFYGPVTSFVSPQLPEIWRCVEATWQQPLKTKAPIAAMAGIIKVVDRSDTTFPGVPSLEESLAAHLLPRAAGWAEGKRSLPPLLRDRDTLEYLDKMFKLGTQMAAAEMTQMKVGQPWAVPQFWGAMSQEAGVIGALPTLGQPLQAWLLRGTG